ncbi:MAG: hypothetical protein AAFN10_04985 [Bacteroidota bacterium]
MKRTLFLAAFLCVAVLSPALMGFINPQAEPRLYINSPIMKTTQVQLAYEVTTPGFVELHLFDPDPDPEVRGEPEKKIWIKGKVTDRIGLDYIAVPLKPLGSGKRYKYILKYKGKDYSSSFYTD